MKARFLEQQSPVKVVTSDARAYIFLCLNEIQGTEVFDEPEGSSRAVNYYEYDYNEIVGPELELPLEDIQAHPENYLDYAYTEEEEKSEDNRVKKLEDQVNGIMEAIERGLTK